MTEGPLGVPRPLVEASMALTLEFDMDSRAMSRANEIERIVNEAGIQTDGVFSTEIPSVVMVAARGGTFEMSRLSNVEDSLRKKYSDLDRVIVTIE